MGNSDGDDRADELSTATEYHHPDGTVEVIFAIEGERVLTVREYPSQERFRAAIENATDAGTNEAVANLPDVEEFHENSGPDNGSDSKSE